MKRTLLTTALLLGCLIAGCVEKTENIDLVNDQAKAVMSLDYRDFDEAASQMVQSVIQSGVLNKADGSRYVMSTGRIVNDTMQRIDTDQLMAKVEQELMNSGQVVMTSAVGSESARDQTVYDVRELRESDVADEFDPDTVVAKKQLVAPELSVSGKIFQRNLRYDKNRQQVEYYFQLKITNLTTGLRFWQKEVILGKRGSNKTVAW
ncbi:MAG: penicillin-binding protein activator LpoB [Sedimentisphaerales bacterium]|nr:penicillin-binding protein activator LpoB [Sedimentisphaerales bacterium]